MNDNTYMKFYLHCNAANNINTIRQQKMQKVMMMMMLKTKEKKLILTLAENTITNNTELIE